jgi:hypothetical protein
MLVSRGSLRATAAAAVMVVIAVIAIQVMEVVKVSNICGMGHNNFLWQQSKFIKCCQHTKPSELSATTILKCVGL